MKTSRFSRAGAKIFGGIVSRGDETKSLEREILLEKAAIPLDWREYAGAGALATVITIIGSAIALLITYWFFQFSVFFIMCAILVAIALLVVPTYYLYLPASKMKKRAFQIDLLLPYAINFISSMAIAGISPSEIFTTLARVDLYGELRREAKKITQEINIMGVDNITALKHAIEISPSRKFQEFLQGIVGTIQSGSELHLYLKNIVDKYMEQDLIERKKDLDLLYVIAEVFVITVIAFPIFLLIILTVFGFFGGSMDMSLFILLVFSFLFLPIIYAGFYVMIRSTSLEALSRLYTGDVKTMKQFIKAKRTPLYILAGSLVAILAIYGGFLLLEYAGFLTMNLYAYVDFAFLSVLVLIGPVGLYYSRELKRRRQIHERLPDFLVEVGDSLATGMTIFDAIKVASKSHYGKLSPEVTKMKKQLSWIVSVREVLQDFAERMDSAIIYRIVLTLNRGLDMGGSTAKIFKAAAAEVGQVNLLENQRRGAMLIYTVVILLCFFVFLAIILILNQTIFTSFFDIQEQQMSGVGGITFSRVDPAALKYTMFSFVFVQSIGAGLIGGFMMDGKISSGVRYSCVLGIISFIMFKVFF